MHFSSVPRPAPSKADQCTIIKKLFSSSSLSISEKGYAISNTWFKKWKDSVGYDSVRTKNEVTPIDNGALLHDGAIRPSLTEGIDFIIITDPIWKKLQHWYGGGPEIAVEIIRDPESKEMVPVLRNSQFTVVFEGQKKSFFISRYKTVGDLKHLACSIYNISPISFSLFTFSQNKKGSLLKDSDLLSKIGQIHSMILDSNQDLIHQRRQSQPSILSQNIQTILLSHPIKIRNATSVFSSTLLLLLNIKPISKFFLSKPKPRRLDNILDCYISVAHDVWSGAATEVDGSLIEEQFSQLDPTTTSDASIMFNAIIQSIHTYTNKADLRGSVDPIYGSDDNDEETARAAREAFRRKNDSIVTDTFSGLMRDEFDCQHCHTKISRFDAFELFSVKMPGPIKRTGYATFIPYDCTSKKVKLQIVCEGNINVSSIKAGLNKMMGREFDIIVGRRTASGIDWLGSIDGDNLVICEIPSAESQYYVGSLTVIDKTSVFGSLEILDEAILVEDDGSENIEGLINRRFAYLWEGRSSVITREIVEFASKAEAFDESEGRLRVSLIHEKVTSKIKGSFVVTVNGRVMNDISGFNWNHAVRGVEQIEPGAIETRTITLEDAFKNACHITTEQWLCPKCKHYSKSIQTRSIWEGPKYLALGIPRFSKDSRGVAKDDTNVIISHEMTIGHLKYELFGMVTHKGDSENGRFIAKMLTSKNEWLSIGSNKIEQAKDDPCLLLYRQK